MILRGIIRKLTNDLRLIIFKQKIKAFLSVWSYLFWRFLNFAYYYIQKPYTKFKGKSSCDNMQLWWFLMWYMCCMKTYCSDAILSYLIIWKLMVLICNYLPIFFLNVHDIAYSKILVIWIIIHKKDNKFSQRQYKIPAIFWF